MSAPTPASAPGEARPGLAVRPLLAVLRLYRTALSPLLGPRCRFAPSCSAYAMTALSRHGLVRGSGLTLWRLLRCHPFHPGGHDPVPPVRRHCGGTVTGEGGTVTGEPTDRLDKQPSLAQAETRTRTPTGPPRGSAARPESPAPRTPERTGAQPC